MNQFQDEPDANIIHGYYKPSAKIENRRYLSGCLESNWQLIFVCLVTVLIWYASGTWIDAFWLLLW